LAIRRRTIGRPPHSHIGKTNPIAPLKQMPAKTFRGRNRTITLEGRNSSITPERSVPIKMNGTPSSKTLRKAYEKSLRLKLNQEFSKKEGFGRAYRADDSNPVIRLEILTKSSPLDPSRAARRLSRSRH
jgi:hypothetical protein